MNLAELVAFIKLNYPQSDVPLKHLDYATDGPIFRMAPKYLFRGERDFYPETLSSKDRLYHIYNFSNDDMNEFLDCASTFVAELAANVIRPLPSKGSVDWKLMLNEVHSWVQHYGIPVMSVDFTASIEVAAFFAALNNSSGKGRIAVTETYNLIDGNEIIQMDRGFSPRAKNQLGYALRMWDNHPDLKDDKHFPIQWFDFWMDTEDAKFAKRNDFLRPDYDWLLEHVIFHLARVSPQRLKVKQLFEKILEELTN